MKLARSRWRICIIRILVARYCPTFRYCPTYSGRSLKYDTSSRPALDHWFDSPSVDQDFSNSASGRIRAAPRRDSRIRNSLSSVRRNLVQNPPTLRAQSVRTVMLVLSTPTRSQIIAHSNAGDANLTLGIKATVVPPSLPSLRPEDNVHITSGSRSNTANGTDNRSPQYLSSESRNASTGAVAISIPILRAALGP